MKTLIIALSLLLISCQKDKPQMITGEKHKSKVLMNEGLGEIKNPVGDYPKKDSEELRKALRNKDFEKVDGIIFQNVDKDHAKGQLSVLVEKYGLDNITLWSSAPLGDFDSVKQAINNGADVDIEIGGKGTALLGAAQVNHLEMVKFLILKGANVNKRTPFGATALSIAVGKNNIEMVDVLINSGASFQRGGDPSHKEYSILTVALATQHFKMVEHLLKRGANANGGNGLPLSFAILMKSEEAIKLLHQSGADLNFKGKKGFRPLMTAVIEGDEKIIKLLLSLGADHRLKDDAGMDAFAWATKYKSKGGEVLKKLLAKKVLK